MVHDYLILLGNDEIGRHSTSEPDPRKVVDEWMRKVPQLVRFGIFRSLMANPGLLRVEEVKA